MPETVFDPPRGLGSASVPKTGDQALPASCFWTKEQIIRERSLAYEPGRVFLGRVDQTPIGVLDNRHLVTIAGSRSGKSACLLIPNLLLYPGSVLVIDPKGELASETARHRAEVLGQEVFVLDPFSVAKKDAIPYRARHNALEEIALTLDPEHPEADERIIDNAALVAEALIISPERGDDHWTISARNVVTALILMEVCGGSPSLPRVRASLMKDAEGLTALFKDMIEFGNVAAGFPSEAVVAASQVIARTGAFMLDRDDRERSSVIATAIEQLAFLESLPMARLLDGHDVSLADLKRDKGGQPVTIYLVLPAGYIGTHFRWLRLMIALALSIFERSDIEPDHAVLLILEEFAALGHLRPIEQAAGYIAGSHVRLWSVLQDLSQLKRHYKEGWETFIGNAGVLQAFSVADLTTCEFLSKKLGQTTLEVVSSQHVNSQGGVLGDTGQRREFRTEALLSPSEIGTEFRRRSIDGQARGGLSLVLVPGAMPFVVDRVFHGELEL